MAKNTFPIEGNLTRDPELRYTQNGNAVCSFGMALENDDNKAVAFVTVVVWGDEGVSIAEDAKKGDHLDIDVRVNTRTYTNNAGQNVWVTEFVKPEDGSFTLTKPKAQNGNRRQGSANTSNNGRSPRQGARQR